MKENTDYLIQVDKEQFFGNTGKVSTVGLDVSEDLGVSVRIAPFPDTTVITLNDILYDLAKATLRPESYPSLDQLVDLLNTNSNLQVGINSHTDARGTDEYNIKLSQDRAQSVVDYLVQKGIEKPRLVAKGYGESRLLNKCADGVECTEEEHQLNRRTEFEILGTNFKTTKIKYRRVTGEEEEEEGQF
jgi:outer membrane protein OmpA-like peptidoglycan-associated protein